MIGVVATEHETSRAFAVNVHTARHPASVIIETHISPRSEFGTKFIFPFSLGIYSSN